MKQAIEYLLFKSGVTNYAINKVTGIAQSSLSDYTTGKTDIGRMPLDVATKLHNYFKEILIMLGDKFGTVNFECKDYVLTQEAYLDGKHEIPYYRASAINIEGIEFKVLWTPVEGWEQIEDGADHCDWDNPEQVIAE